METGPTIGKEGGVAIGQSLRGNGTLRLLYMECLLNSICDHNFLSHPMSTAQISGDGCRAIAEALMKNSSLTSLSLPCLLWSRLFSIVWIFHPISIVVLDNRICDAQCFVDTLKCNKSLCALDLSGLLDFIFPNQPVSTTLCMSKTGNMISDDCKALLQAVASSRPDFKLTLWFSSRCFSSCSQSILCASVKVPTDNVPAPQSPKRGWDYRAMASSQGTLSDGWKRGEEMVGFDWWMVWKWESWGVSSILVNVSPSTRPSSLRDNHVCIIASVFLQTWPVCLCWHVLPNVGTVWGVQKVEWLWGWCHCRAAISPMPGSIQHCVPCHLVCPSFWMAVGTVCLQEMSVVFVVSMPFTVSLFACAMIDHSGFTNLHSKCTSSTAILLPHLYPVCWLSVKRDVVCSTPCVVASLVTAQCCVDWLCAQTGTHKERKRTAHRCACVLVCVMVWWVVGECRKKSDGMVDWKGGERMEWKTQSHKSKKTLFSLKPLFPFFSLLFSFPKLFPFLTLFCCATTHYLSLVQRPFPSAMHVHIHIEH